MVKASKSFNEINLDIVKKGTLGAVALSTIPLVGFARLTINYSLSCIRT